MAVTVSGTSITFNDATVQTTAAVADSKDYGGIGSYVMAYYGATGPANSGRSNFIANGATLAGSSLRVSSRTTSNNVVAGAGAEVFNNSVGSRIYGGASSTFPTSNSITLTGTWRVMNGGAWSFNESLGCSPAYYWIPLLWVRIS